MKSKKRCATSSAKEQPEPIVFYVDECLGRGVGEALKQAGEEVRFYGEAVPRGARDTDWLARIGEGGWVCLTKDKHIRRRLVERSALLAARVKAFVLTSGNLTGAEMAEVFVRNLPKIRSLAARTKAPFIAKVTRSNVVELY